MRAWCAIDRGDTGRGAPWNGRGVARPTGVGWRRSRNSARLTTFESTKRRCPTVLPLPSAWMWGVTPRVTAEGCQRGGGWNAGSGSFSSRSPAVEGAEITIKDASAGEVFRTR